MTAAKPLYALADSADVDNGFMSEFHAADVSEDQAWIEERAATFNSHRKPEFRSWAVYKIERVG